MMEPTENAGNQDKGIPQLLVAMETNICSFYSLQRFLCFQRQHYQFYHLLMLLIQSSLNADREFSAAVCLTLHNVEDEKILHNYI